MANELVWSVISLISQTRYFSPNRAFNSFFLKANLLCHSFEFSCDAIGLLKNSCTSWDVEIRDPDMNTGGISWLSAGAGCLLFTGGEPVKLTFCASNPRNISGICSRGIRSSVLGTTWLPLHVRCMCLYPGSIFDPINKLPFRFTPKLTGRMFKSGGLAHRAAELMLSQRSSKIERGDAVATLRMA